jgi:hypothetical protein
MAGRFGQLEEPAFCEIDIRLVRDSRALCLRLLRKSLLEPATC